MAVCSAEGAGLGDQSLTAPPAQTLPSTDNLPSSDNMNLAVPAREVRLPPGQRDLTGVPLEDVRSGKWNFSARASSALTLTDNVNLAPSGQEKADLVLGISVPLGVRRAGPRVKFLAEYVPTVYLYARNGQSDNLQNNLRSFLSVEAVDDYFFIDAIANIYQTYISPFQPRPQSGASITDNRTQQATLGLSPYIRHKTSNGWTYQARSDNFWNTYSGSDLADSVASRFSAEVDSPTRARVSYGLDYTYLYTRDAAQPSAFYQQVARLRPILRATRKLNASARLGYESNDYAVTPYAAAVYGAGIDWTPTPRTRLDGFLEHRFFGPSYGLNFNNRTRRTVWRLSGTRNTTTTIEQPLTQRPGTTAELLNDAYRSRISDPEQREQAVRQFLQGTGLPPSLTQPYSFHTNQVYVSEQWTGSVVLLGRRNTVEFTAFWQQNDPVATGSAAPPGVTPFTPFRQQGFTLNFSHRLSGFSSVTLSANRLYTQTVDSSALAATGQAKSVQDTVRIGLTHQLGQKTDGSIGLRWVNFDSSGSASLVGPPYQELAVLAALAHSF